MEKHVALLRRGRTGPVIRSLVSACLLCLLSHLPGFAAQSSQTATRPAEPRTPAKPPAARPNIVILLADDLGIGDVGYNGSKIRTPHIDKLAATGVRLNQFYAAPICSPARAALLTGRYPIRYGFQSALIWPWVEWGLGAEERTLAEALKQAGYRTALLGKWHLGHAREAYLPRRRGFDHHYGCYTGSVDYFEHTTNAALDWHRDGVPVEEEGYTTTLLAEEAVRLIRDSDHKRPLFLLVSFNAPHLPLQAPPGYRERYEHLKHPGRRIYAGMVTCMDEAIGQVVAAL
ncbi:MAG: sulfatase-like hydrolase/transferase, partial [Dehalococcoidia bacterium]